MSNIETNAMTNIIRAVGSITKVTEYFDFADLSEKAQELAHQKYTEYCVEPDFDYVIEDANEFMSMLGFTNIHWHYRVGDRGEYVNFSADYTYKKGMRQAIKESYPNTSELLSICSDLLELQKKHAYKLHGSISVVGIYGMSQSLDLSYGDDRYYDGADTDYLDILESIKSHVLSSLKGEYDYAYSLENFNDYIDNNDVVFTECGNEYIYRSELTKINPLVGNN